MHIQDVNDINVGTVGGSTQSSGGRQERGEVTRRRLRPSYVELKAKTGVRGLWEDPNRRVVGKNPFDFFSPPRFWNHKVLLMRC